MIRWCEAVRSLRGWRRGGLALVAGVLTALPLPPFDLWPLLFLGVPLAVLLLQGVTGRRQAFWTGWLYGLGYFGFAFHWIGYAFLVDAETYLWMMPFMVGGLAAGMAIYWGLAALAAKVLGLDGVRLALGFPALLAIAEWLRGHLFTGFPWAAPGLAVDGMGALAQAASLVGMTGLTLMLVLWAALPLLWLSTGHRRLAMTGAMVLALMPLSWAWGEVRLQGAAADDTAGPSVRIIQPNISQDAKWRSGNARAIFDQLLVMSGVPSDEYPGAPAGIDYIVWPESAVPFLIDESDIAQRELGDLLQDHTVLVTGALRRGRQLPGGERQVFNSIVTFDGNGHPVAHYDKWRLVPGGEFLPFEWLLEPLGFRKVVTVPGSFAAGPGPVTIDLPGGLKAAMLVCYEAIFPHQLVDPGHRPQLLLNVTNDGWFGHSTGPYQHLAQARLRSIEQGLPLIRAANTGISAIVSAYGQTIKELPLGQDGVLDGHVPQALAPTVYAQFGDGPFGVMAVALLLLALGLRRPVSPAQVGGL